MANSLYRNKEFFINGNSGTMNKLEGRFAFIDQLDKHNNSTSKKQSNTNGSHRPLLSNRREYKYQEFLFYNNFISNPRSLIITEGKTDIVYIKAALKNMYLSYPSLISKNENGWTYNIAFFKRTAKISYLFRLSHDGADSMEKIYELYANPHTSNAKIGYWTLFSQVYSTVALHPVILLFDNEFVKDGPIKKFVNKAGLAGVTIKKQNYDKIIGNLFIQTIPLVSDKKKAEIEDLFDDSITSMKLYGRSFDRTGKQDPTKYFNKNDLSKYVMSNYETINFKNFIPLLNTIAKICTLTVSA